MTFEALLLLLAIGVVEMFAHLRFLSLRAKLSHIHRLLSRTASQQPPDDGGI